MSADDFLLGFVGSKSEAEEIKSEHLRAMWLAGENPGASRSRGSKTCTAGTERETSLGQGDGSSPPQGPRRLRRASTRGGVGLELGNDGAAEMARSSCHPHSHLADLLQWLVPRGYRQERDALRMM